MSDPGPADPFRGLPFFGDLAKLLGNQGPMAWDAARQLAHAIATDGTSEPNVDPVVRMRLAELSRVAELHVSQVLGLSVTRSGGPVQIVPVTPGQWAERSLAAYRPLFERLGSAISAGATPGEELDEADPTAAMLGPLMAMLGPTMLGMAAGSMVGHLARRSFGQYDLPIPRPDSDEVLVVADTVQRFADDWSLPLDELSLWVCLSELSVHAVLGVPHVRTELERLIGGFVSGFRPDSRALEERMLSAGDGLEDMQRSLADPSVLLGAMSSPDQQQLVPALDAIVAVIVGTTDHVLDTAGRRLISSSGLVSEAMRRKRVEPDTSDTFVQRLLGLRLGHDQVERGGAFVRGVLERAGDDGLSALWRSARALPTPAEVDAPGLWLARLELDDGTSPD